MDAEEIAAKANFPVAFMGNHDATDFELIELDATPLPPELVPRLAARGLFYLGCAGILNGLPVCTLKYETEPQTAHMLARAHAEYIRVRLIGACLEVPRA